ncbi:MAG: hypothetical protein ACE5K3_00920 [bacterium]
MPYKDIEKKRAADRKYRRSEKGKAATRRWREAHKTELAKKREEKAMKRREAFWKELLIRDGKAWWSHIHLVKRLWFMRRAGKDIDFDPGNAKYIYAWENRGRFKKKEKEPSVGSRDYY